jgi:hypothetical protein
MLRNFYAALPLSNETVITRWVRVLDAASRLRLCNQLPTSTTKIRCDLIWFDLIWSQVKSDCWMNFCHVINGWRSVASLSPLCFLLLYPQTCLVFQRRIYLVTYSDWLVNAILVQYNTHIIENSLHLKSLGNLPQNTGLNYCRLSKIKNPTV